MRAALCTCFDLNFTDLLTHYSLQKPNLVLFSSYYHGGLKQQQWSYELRSYMVAAVRNNQSTITNPYGKILASTTEYQYFASASINLDFAIVHLDHNWDKIVQAKGKYKDELDVYDPGNIGTVLMSRNSENGSIQDILKQFEIKTYDEYLQDSIHFRNKQLK